MIKDVFKLRKGAWYIKLMKWTWGWDHSDFRNFCPLFWITILNIVIFIPFSLIKLLILLIGWIGNSIYDACERKAENWSRDFAHRLEKMDDKAIREYFECDENPFEWHRIKKYQQVSRYLGTKGLFTTEYFEDEVYRKGWEERMAQMRERYILLREIEQDRLKKAHDILAELEARKKPRKSRQQRIGELTVKIKKVATIFFYVVIFFLTYAAYSLVKWMITFDWYIIGEYCLDGLVWGCIGGAGLVVIYLLVKIISTGVCVFSTYCYSCEQRKRRIKAFFRPLRHLKYLGYPFLWLWMILCWIGRGLTYLWDILVAIKSNNCPGIDWD